jgi:hypothetical protein
MKRAPVMNLIRKAKLQNELKFMYSMTKPIIDMALADKFSRPKKKICKAKTRYPLKKALDGHGMESVATMDSLNELRGDNFMMSDFSKPQSVLRVKSSPIDKISVIKSKSGFGTRGRSSDKKKISKFDIFDDNFRPQNSRKRTGI